MNNARRAEASEQDQYQESTVCHDCLYRYQGDCRHSHGPLVPNKGVCGGKVLVQAKAPAPLPINAVVDDFRTLVVVGDWS